MGSKIYKNRDSDRAIHKCYQELKNSIGFNKEMTEFIVLNIDSNELYNYKIDRQSNPTGEPLVHNPAMRPESNPTNKPLVIDLENPVIDPLKELADRVTVIEHKLVKLESHAMGQPMAKPMGQPIGQPIGQPMGQPTEKPIAPTAQPTSKPQSIFQQIQAN